MKLKVVCDYCKKEFERYESELRNNRHNLLVLPSQSEHAKLHIREKNSGMGVMKNEVQST